MLFIELEINAKIISYKKVNVVAAGKEEIVMEEVMEEDCYF